MEKASRGSYAVRVVKAESNIPMKELVAEGLLVKTIDPCKYVVQWFTLRKEETTLFVLMEKCACTLTQKLKSASAPWNQQKTVDIFKQMLRGVSWVHSAGVVHRNIKASNFLFGGEGGNTVKLADFKLAAAIQKKALLKKKAGSLPYMSPEMLCGVGYSRKTDMWSFGVMSYSLLFGEFPYAPDNMCSRSMRAAIINQKEEPRFIAVSPGARAGDVLGSAGRFCRVLLRHNPDIRCSASDAFQLSFIGGEDSAMELETRVMGINFGPAAESQMQDADDTLTMERSFFSKALLQQELPPVPLALNELDNFLS